MRIQIVGAYEKKANKVKIAGIILFILVLILGITYKSQYDKHIIKKIDETEQQAIVEENQDKTASENTNNDGKYIPILTKEGKQNIKNIYKSDVKIAYLTFDDRTFS